MKRNDVLERCRLASEAIIHLPPAEWAGWICWMLEALDEADGWQRPDNKDDNLVLKAVCDDLVQRLSTGRW